MLRVSTAALFVLTSALGAGQSPADEIRGKAKDINGDKGTITVTVGAADQTYTVASDAKVVGLYGKKLKKATAQDVPGGLRGVTAGSEVSLIKDDKNLVTQVKVEDLQAKIKKTKTKKKNKNK